MSRFPQFSSLLLSIGLLSSPLAAEDLFPSNVTILTQEDLVGRNIYSVGDALEGLPSINIEREGGRGQLALGKMRGQGPAQTLILMDGRSLMHEFDSQVDLSQIPINIVNRIEITRGGASTSYTGQAVAGVINLITERPMEKGLHTQLGTGIGRDGIRHSQGKFFLRNNWGDLSYLGGLEKGNAFSHNAHHETNTHFLSITRSFNGKGYWGAEYYFERSKAGLNDGTPIPFEEWNSHLEDEPFDREKRRHQDSQHGRLNFSYPLLAGGTVYANVTQSLREAEIRLTEEGQFLRKQRNRSQDLKLSWRRKGFEMGSELQRFKRELKGSDNDTSRHNAFYALNKWTGARWMLLPGVRYEDDSIYGDIWTPRLTGAFKAHEKIIFSFSSQKSHRAPTYDELFIATDTLNNSNLKAEKVVSSDAGVELKPVPDLSVKWTGFFSKTEGMIQSDPATLRWENRGDGETKGIESEVSWEFGKTLRHLHMKITGNHTYQVSRVSFHDGAGFVPAARTPNNVAFVRLDNILPRKLTLSNELRYESRQFEDANRQGDLLPGHSVWNMRIKIKVLKAHVHIDMENVLNRPYAEGFGRVGLWPQPARTFWAGVTMKFDN